MFVAGKERLLIKDVKNYYRNKKNEMFETKQYTEFKCGTDIETGKIVYFLSGKAMHINSELSLIHENDVLFTEEK